MSTFGFYPSSLLPLCPVEAIEALHLGEDAAVTFHRKVNTHKSDEQWQDLGAIMLSELRSKWLSIAQHVVCDSYFSINSTYKQTKSTRVSEVSGLPIYSRKAERLRWLNCIVLDVDIYKNRPSCSFDESMEAFALELGRQDLPLPNYVCSSGRGIWALWSIRDHLNQSTPVPAFSERREIYQRVNMAIVKRFAHLGADRNCTDPSRVMRVPDSINTNTLQKNRFVRFFKWTQETRTLPEFGHILGVKARKVQLPGERTGPKDPEKVNAGLMRWSVPLDGFRRLWSIRGFFGRGVRHSALYIYAALLRKTRVPEREISNACSRLAASCRPPLTGQDVARCVLSSSKCASRAWHQSISNAAIARMLEVSTDEKAKLCEWFKPQRNNKAVRIAERRLRVMHELQQAGRWTAYRGDWISSRELAHLLFEKHRIVVSHVTVAQDLRFLYNRYFYIVTRDPTPRPVNFSLLDSPPPSLSCTSRGNLTAPKLTPPSRANLAVDASGNRSVAPAMPKSAFPCGSARESGLPNPRPLGADSLCERRKPGRTLAQHRGAL